MEIEKEGEMRKLIIVGFEEEGIEEKEMLERKKGVGGNEKEIDMEESLGDKSKIEEVRKEKEKSNVVRVDEIVEVMERIEGKLKREGNFGIKLN